MSDGDVEFFRTLRSQHGIPARDIAPLLTPEVDDYFRKALNMEPGPSDDAVTVTLTKEQAYALRFAWVIEEYPTSNPLGSRGGMVLDGAEKAIDAALDGWEPPQ